MRKALFIFLLLSIVQNGKAQVIDTLINVGNHNLHFKIIKGSGTPILFESGNGDDGSVWEPLLEKIHKKTGASLIAYDRAGLGKSGIDTLNISFKNEIENLEIALNKLGYSKEIFSVAHSFGGFYASLFSYRNENRVKGAVFIDIGTPCYLNENFTTDYKNSLPDEVWGMLKNRRIGLYFVLKNFPEISKYMSTRYISDSIPLTLIVAESLPDQNTAKTEEDKIRWVECLKEFGNLPNHKYVLAKGTEHKVWEKNQQIVIDEITELYNRTVKNKH
jgi:pimeloyl-ACP methyl ester carboxylesterase